MTHIETQASIYLDHAATTPVLPEVVEAMDQIHLAAFGNPSSRHHIGLFAEEHLRKARGTIAQSCGVPPQQVIFTSGGTEANATGILGTAAAQRGKGHVLVSAMEHASVLQTALMLERFGIVVEKIPVNTGGWIDLEELETLLRPDTFLVAVMHVNNETGICQPVEQIVKVIRRQAPQCKVLVDCVQSFLSLPTKLNTLGADFMTISAHKIHGPKGVGGLIVGPGIRLTPIWGGGDQELGRRPGTENVAGIVGFSKAVELHQTSPAKLARMGKMMFETIQAKRPDAYLVGDAEKRVPHIISVAIPDAPTEVLVNLLQAKGVCASSGSACHSRRNLRSHVLEALQIPREHGVIRLSFSYTTTEDEVAQAAEIIASSLIQI